MATLLLLFVYVEVVERFGAHERIGEEIVVLCGRSVEKAAVCKV